MVNIEKSLPSNRTAPPIGDEWLNHGNFTISAGPYSTKAFTGVSAAEDAINWIGHYNPRNTILISITSEELRNG